MPKKFYLIIPLVAIALFGPGCSCGQKIAEKAMEKAVESATNSDIDISGEKVAVNTNGETMEWGEGAELSKDFPTDVPIYKGSTITSSSSSATDETYSATISSTDKYENVTSYYTSELPKQGWTIDDTYNYSDTTGQSTFYSASKNDRDLSISVFESEGTSNIGITVSKSTD